MVWNSSHVLENVLNEYYCLIINFSLKPTATTVLLLRWDTEIKVFGSEVPCNWTQKVLAGERKKDTAETFCKAFKSNRICRFNLLLIININFKHCTTCLMHIFLYTSKLIHVLRKFEFSKTDNWIVYRLIWDITETLHSLQLESNFL